jgi:hypothetical protein
MPYNYVTVKASSELFAPATRAFGDILVIGKGPVGNEASSLLPARDFTYPSEAAKAFPKARTKLSTKADAKDTTVTTPLDLVKGTVVTLGEDAVAEVRTITASTATLPGGGGTAGENAEESRTFDWTLDDPLEHDHDVGTVVVAPGLSDLSAAISVAFRQTPPPTRIWAIEVANDTPDWSTALTEAEDLAVQIEVFANTPLGTSEDAQGGAEGEEENAPEAAPHPVELLATHVDTVSNTGGDGKERIGVAMLDPTLAVKDQVDLNVGAIHTNRMVLIAHKSSEDDVAAAVAGVIAGYEPHVSLLLKPLSIDMTGQFTVTEIDALYAGSVNWVTSPAMLPGHGLYLGEGLTASPTGNKKYIDIVRTLDDISFRVKAALIEAVGDLRIDRPGLRTVVTLVQTVLSPLVGRGVIEDYTVHIPLLVLLERDRATLTAGEVKLIGQQRSSRTVDMELSVVYAGVIHQITVRLALKG